ncbi:MAG: sigma-70 family RNA polymerase sigma factor [Rubrobacteraceae bacterium]
MTSATKERKSAVRSNLEKGGADRTIGRLWKQYLDARARLQEHAEEGPRYGEAKRQVNRLRDRLVVNYSPLVKYVAGRVSARSISGADGEDVLAWGVMGLLRAIETFETGRGAKFETYAISKIRWAILDEMRKADPLPRSLRRRLRDASLARDELSQTLRRSPTEEEVALEMGVEVEAHLRTMSRGARNWAASPEAGDLYDLVVEHAGADPESAAETEDLRLCLAEAIATLDERERTVTTFYFYEGLTLREIGKALGLTEGRISQILKKALMKLRESLSEEYEVLAAS